MPGEIRIGKHLVGAAHPTYFVADIAANHDGDLERAKQLIHLAAAAGAAAAKFQNFTADTIVSDRGFEALGRRLSHQTGWSKPVVEVYRDATLDVSWTPILRETADQAGIDYFTAPYSLELVDAVDPYVEVHKIGSGDITWLEIVAHIAGKGKPVLLATGASALDDVRRAVDQVLAVNDRLVLMQCNTNYTGKLENFRHINLNVLRTFAKEFPGVVLGLSDHTPGHATTLGAVTLGARVVEKHFTDDRTRTGPDHPFSMTPDEWREMVDRTRELEAALGDGVKRIEENEEEAAVVQRRALRAARDLRAGETLDRGSVTALRPWPSDALGAEALESVLGRVARRDIPKGEALRQADLT